METEVCTYLRKNVLLVDSEELQKDGHSVGIDPKISAKDRCVHIPVELPEVQYDNFSIALYKALNYYDSISMWETMGRTGMGARFTMAMNIQRNNDIGHPSSDYVWDIVSTAEHCFDFFSWHLYVGEGYNNRARDTAAQSDRLFSDRISVIKGGESVEGPVVYTSTEGDWMFSEEAVVILNDDILPFGPIALKITGFTPSSLVFPKSMFSYLINTLERGEEPMEIVGRNHISAVSGWKAFARWMQSLSVPIKGMINNYQVELAKILLERRAHFVYYLEQLSSDLEGNERVLIQQLADDYMAIIKPAQDVVDHGISQDAVRTLYFTEQRTLPTYKAIRNQLKVNRR